MPVSSGVFSAPIDLRRDIAGFFGIGSGDLGYLITNAPINKWAKFKPYRYPSVETSSVGRQAAFYGLSVETFTALGTNPATAGTFLQKLVAGQLTWDYARPRGKATNSEWFRALDFDGYDHNSVCPVGELGSYNIPITQGNAIIAWDLPSQLSDGNLKLTDLRVDNVQLSRFYLGVLLYKSDSSYHIVTSDSVLGSGDVQVTLSGLPDSIAGTWKMYPFFSSLHYDLDQSQRVGKYIAAGWDTPYKEITFRLASQSMSVYAYGVWNSAHTQIQFFVEAFNEDSIAKTISVQIILRRNQNGAVEPTSETTLATYPTTLQLTVPAGGSIRYPAGESLLFWTPGVTYSDNYFYWLGAVVSGYTTHFVQIEEDPGVMPE